MIIKNNTHYIGEYSKVFNTFPDTNSFLCESSKRLGYFQRLFFEYAYTRKVRGIVFYYTLTYNNKSIPVFHGRNCFNYNHIRSITHGAVEKVLKRQYGSRLRYFCACETGEGKGIRGLGNNPHYHFIFFVQPLHDKDNNPLYDNFRCISPNTFKDLIYTAWQGHNSSVRIPWQLAKFGHCQEGKYNGEVLSCEAFKYVGKYVVKDQNERNYESKLAEEFYKEAMEENVSNRVLYLYYKYLKTTNPFENIDKYKFFEFMHLHEYNQWRKYNTIIEDKSWYNYVHTSYKPEILMCQYACYDIQDWFTTIYVPTLVQEKLSEYRNMYSGKARMSKTLGEYGLNFITWYEGSPRIVLNLTSGYEVEYPCLFYIRKLFYNVKVCPVTGNPLYYLNDFGVQMKRVSLPLSLRQFVSHVHENLSYKELNHIPVGESVSDSSFIYLLDCIVYNKPFNIDYTDHKFNSFLQDPDKDEIIRRYSIWHFVYQYRNCVSFDNVRLSSDCLDSDVYLDYDTFLRQNSYFLDYERGTVYDMVYKNSLQSFRSHPAFSPYIKYFDYLDKLMEQVDSDRGCVKKSNFAEKSAHQKRLNRYKFQVSDVFSTPIDKTVQDALSYFFHSV